MERAWCRQRCIGACLLHSTIARRKASYGRCCAWVLRWMNVHGIQPTLTYFLECLLHSTIAASVDWYRQCTVVFWLLVSWFSLVQNVLMHSSCPKYLSRFNSLLHSAGSLPYYFQKCCHLLPDPVFKRRKKKKQPWWQVGGRERVLLRARAEVIYCHFLPGRRKASISHSLRFSHGNHSGALWTHLLFAPV